MTLLLFIVFELKHVKNSQSCTEAKITFSIQAFIFSEETCELKSVTFRTKYSIFNSSTVNRINLFNVEINEPTVAVRFRSHILNINRLMSEELLSNDRRCNLIQGLQPR